MSGVGEFDKLVGRVAGAIYSDISGRYPQPPLRLVPALTFKVRRILQQCANPKTLSEEEKAALAKDIQASIIPMLLTYEIEAGVVEQIKPVIELAALRALLQTTKKEGLNYENSD